MDYHGKRTLCNFIDEENKTQQQMSEENDHFTPPRTSTTTTTTYSLMPPPSPNSPWTLSPLQTPSPYLLHNCIASLHRQEGQIYSIAVSHGLVFTGTESTRIHAWRQPDLIERGQLRASSGEVRSLVAYGNMLFSSHKDNKVRVWNITNSDTFRYKKVITLPKKCLFGSFHLFTKTSALQHKERVSCMTYYHAEGLLYTASWDKTVKAWRLSDDRCIDSFVGHDDHINGIVVNQEDGFVFTCSSDGSVKIWRRVYKLSSHTLTMTLKFQPSPINALALTNSTYTTTFRSCVLYSGSSDGFVNFWEREKLSGRFNHGGFLQGHRFAVLCLAAIENLIFSGSEDTTIRVWRREKASGFHVCLSVLDAHRGPVRCLEACLERERVREMGFLVYSACLDQSFKVWRVKLLDGDEKRVCLNDDHMERSSDWKIMEYGMSPVLSPSWVERKVHGYNLQPSFSLDYKKVV